MSRVKTKGVIRKIFDRTRMNSIHTKRLLWVETLETKPQNYEIQFWNAKAELLDKFIDGQIVEVEYDVRGRYWQKDGKEGVFNYLIGENIENG